MSGQWSWTGDTHFPSQLGEHLPFLEEVLQRLAKLGWDGRDLFGVQMTLEETLTNAIRHGNGSDANKIVKASCKISEQDFWLTVEDEGTGYDPACVKDCTADENLEALGGRGMLLIHAYMNKVDLNEQGNQITVSTYRGYHPEVDA